MASGTTRLDFASTRVSSAWREEIWVTPHPLVKGSANSGYITAPATGSISYSAALSSCCVAGTSRRNVPTLDEPSKWLETGEVDFYAEHREVRKIRCRRVPAHA